MIRENNHQNTTARAPLCKTITGHNVSAEHSKIDNINKNNNMNIKEPTRLRPPPREYDPDAIFGGDSDEDPYDYSDDEDLYYDNNSTSAGYDPGPCAPRPLSQGQPTTEGLRAWNEERGLFLWGRTLITPLTEADITPSYPFFTPSNLGTLGTSSPDTFPSPPLETAPLPLPLPVYDWDSLAAPSCGTAGTEAACCSCEPSSLLSADSLDSHNDSSTDLSPDPTPDSDGHLLVSWKDGTPQLDKIRRTSADVNTVSPPRSNDSRPLDEPQAEPSTSMTMEWTSPLTTLLPPGNSSDCSKHQRRTTKVEPTKRPWLTPPLPSNMAWRGWEQSKSKASMIKIRPPRQPHSHVDFSLSVNDRPKRHIVKLRQINSRQPNRNTTPPVVMTQWTPKTGARRRLERRRSQHSLMQTGYTRAELTLSHPPKIDNPLKNKEIDYNTITITEQLDNNQNISVIPLFINFLDSFPEYKTLMYWEVKAG